MKLLLIATLLTSFAYADNHKEENFSEMKAKASANIDQKISQMQSHKSCVQNAKDHAAMKACRQSQKDAMKKLHKENKGERKEWKAGMKEKREKWKAEKKDKKSN